MAGAPRLTKPSPPYRPQPDPLMACYYTLLAAIGLSAAIVLLRTAWSDEGVGPRICCECLHR